MKPAKQWCEETGLKEFPAAEGVVRLIQADAMEAALKTAEALLRHSRVLFEQTGNPALEHAAKAIAKERESLG